MAYSNLGCTAYAKQFFGKFPSCNAQWCMIPAFFGPLHLVLEILVVPTNEFTSKMMRATPFRLGRRFLQAALRSFLFGTDGRSFRFPLIFHETTRAEEHFSRFSDPDCNINMNISMEDDISTTELLRYFSFCFNSRLWWHRLVACTEFELTNAQYRSGLFLSL